MTPLGGEGLVVPVSGVAVLSTSAESRGLSPQLRRYSTSSANISCHWWPAWIVSPLGAPVGICLGHQYYTTQLLQYEKVVSLFTC